MTLSACPAKWAQCPLVPDCRARWVLPFSTEGLSNLPCTLVPCVQLPQLHPSPILPVHPHPLALGITGASVPLINFSNLHNGHLIIS